jgi:hypothetical protein
VLEPLDWYGTKIEVRPERVSKYHSYDKSKQKLEDSPDEIMGVVRAFEYDRIDPGLLPDYKRAPEEGSGRKRQDKAEGSISVACLVTTSLTPQRLDTFLEYDRDHYNCRNRIGPPPIEPGVKN